MTPSRHVPTTVMAVVAMVLLATAARVAVAASGWFYWDDLLLHSEAAGHRWPDPGLLLRPHDGHLMPGGGALAWIAAHIAPLRWWMPVAQIAVLHLAASAAVARLLWVLGRGRPVAVLVPLVLALTCPLGLPAAAWWSSALLSLPLVAALAWGSSAAVLYSRTGGARYAVSAVAATVVGLLFVEKAVLVPFVAVGLALADRHIRPQDALPPRSLARRCAPPWAGQLAVVAAWAAVYAAVVGDPASGDHEGASPWALLDRAYRLSVLPTLAGGPWGWERWHPGPPFAAPPTAAVVAGAAVGGAGLVWAVACHRRVVGLWVAAAAYPAVSVAAVVWARSGAQTSDVLVQTLRYHADAVVVLAAALALTLVAEPRRTVPSTRGGAALAWVLVTAFVLSSSVSTASFRTVWADQPARDYLVPLVDSLRGRETPLLDRQVPLEVLLPLVEPDNWLSHVLTGIPGIAPVQRWTTEAEVVDAHGAIHPGEVTWSRRLGLGPEPGCGHRIAASGTRIPLDGPLVGRDWVVTLNYFSGGGGTAEVRLDDGAAVTVPVEPGLHTVLVTLVGGGSGVTVTPGGGVGDLCVGDGPVGVVAPR